MNIKNIETFLSDNDNLNLILNHNYKDLWVRFESEYRVSASDLMIVLWRSNLLDLSDIGNSIWQRMF